MASFMVDFVCEINLGRCHPRGRLEVRLRFPPQRTFYVGPRTQYGLEVEIDDPPDLRQERRAAGDPRESRGAIGFNGPNKGFPV